MWLQVHVEEPSVEAALRILLPRLVPPETTIEIIQYNGKEALLRKLPQRLSGLRHWIPDEMKIMVLLDRDDDDCHGLKQILEDLALNAGLITKSVAGDSAFHMVIRLAIEELEAWFFGDTEALHRAFPRIPVSLKNRERYRNPDEIEGGTWESLERLLVRNNYYADRMPKIEVARLISMHMNPNTNRSRSFQVFRDAVIELAEVV